MSIILKNRNFTTNGNIKLTNRFNTGNLRLKVPTTNSSDIVLDHLICYYDPANVASYPGSGGTITDLSGQGNDGSLVGTWTYQSAFNGFFEFSAASSYITTTTLSPMLYNKTNTTISIWTKIYSNSTNYYNVGFNSPSNSEGYRYTVLIYSGVAYVAIESATTTFGSVFGLGFNDTWNEFTFAYDGNGTTQFYVNGTSTYSSTAFFPSALSNAIPNPTFGNIIGSNTTNGVGQILVYDKTLNSTEIANNYNARKTRYGL